MAIEIDKCPNCIEGKCLFHGRDENLVSDGIGSGYEIKQTEVNMEDYFPKDKFPQLHKEGETTTIIREEL